MRISKDQLQDLINEEVSRILLKRENRTLIKRQAKFLKESLEEDTSENIMSLDDLIDFARAYSRLQPEDRKNLDLILDGRGEVVTPEEIEDLQRVLSGYHQELTDYLDDALKASAMYTDEEDDGSWSAAEKLNHPFS